jgi:hypothetical protein
VRTNFDYGEYVEAVSPPEKTLALTPRGAVLRQAVNPRPATDQLKGTGFSDIHCNLRNRTWSVEYTNALDPKVWGKSNTTVLARCYSGNVATFYLDQIPGSRVDYVSPSQVTTFVQFVMNNSDVKQLVLACSFQLFVYGIDNPVLQLPMMIQNFEHLCTRSDGKACDIYELFCLIDTNNFKGAAIFWYAIYFLELVVLVGIGLYWRTTYLIEYNKNYMKISKQLYGEDIEVDVDYAFSKNPQYAPGGETREQVVAKINAKRNELLAKVGRPEPPPAQVHSSSGLGDLFSSGRNVPRRGYQE